LNPPHDNNKDPTRRDRWDLDGWDLYSTDGPDDFEIRPDEDEETDPHLELVESLDEDSLAGHSVWLTRAIRLTALVVLIFFATVFALPSALGLVRSAIVRPTSPDYYSRISSDGRPLRFERREVRYSLVIPSSFSQHVLTYYQAPLLRAMQSWSDALGGAVSFVPAPAAGVDDLLVHFVPDLPSAGLATLRPGTRYRPEIFIRIDVQGPMPSQIMLETVACHELGHALGIWGHSDYEGDCMYPIASRRTPSARDMRTIRLIYGLEGGIE